MHQSARVGNPLHRSIPSPWPLSALKRCQLGRSPRFKMALIPSRKSLATHRNFFSQFQFGWPLPFSPCEAETSPAMHISDLPQEIFRHILLLATRANEVDGVTFSYGLSGTCLPLDRDEKLTKYVRGPVSADSLRWDGVNAIRQVCSSWHEWALDYSLEYLFEKKGQGSERWANLPKSRSRYRAYEYNKCTGLQALFSHPWASLMRTNDLFRACPSTARHVRRLWLNGFNVAETDKLILSIVSSCPNLIYLSVPWTVLRRGSADDWMDVLKVDRGTPLYSLELTAVCLPKMQAEMLEDDGSRNPIENARVDFGALKRLKIFGNTLHKPISDYDLELIARTAKTLECLDLTNSSTTSVAGMLALVKASHQTLQVLEHSPRSDDGFFHPFPGNIHQHVCELIASLPHMRDLSVSVPRMCATLFSNHDVKWSGECQVRALDVCDDCLEGPDLRHRVRKLREAFDAARALIAARKRLRHDLSIEIFFAECIFEPAKRLVHGDFGLSQVSSDGRWPSDLQHSTKGPYGNSGVYGKAEGTWGTVSEDDYLLAVEQRWLSL